MVSTYSVLVPEEQLKLSHSVLCTSEVEDGVELLYVGSLGTTEAVLQSVLHIRC